MADRIFIVRGIQHAPQYFGVVITPESVASEAVVAAWSHAVRYTAKGYDVPDYDAALASLPLHHPDWKISPHQVVNISYDPTKADIP